MDEMKDTKATVVENSQDNSKTTADGKPEAQNTVPSDKAVGFEFAGNTFGSKEEAEKSYKEMRTVYSETKREKETLASLLKSKEETVVKPESNPKELLPMAIKLELLEKPEYAKLEREIKLEIESDPHLSYLLNAGVDEAKTAIKSAYALARVKQASTAETVAFEKGKQEAEVKESAIPNTVVSGVKPVATSPKSRADVVRDIVASKGQLDASDLLEETLLCDAERKLLGLL